MSAARSLFRPSLTVGAFTLLSRLTGFLRDAMIAQVLGAGLVADSFLVAFKLPNLFAQIFADNALSSVFVPLFSSLSEHRGRRAAWAFADQVWSVLILLAAAFSLLMVVLMPWAMLVFAPGLGEVPGRRALAVLLARIAFPYFIFAALAALLTGMLNALGRFAAAAAAMSILNVTLVAVLVLRGPGMRADHALAWGAVLAGVLQVLWLLAAVRRAGRLPRLVRPRPTPEARTMLRRLLPATLGGGLAQINMLSDTLLASLLPTGALSYLYYAERVSLFPLGVVGIAVGTVLLPLLSRQLAGGDPAAAADSQNRALEAGLFLILPSAAGLLVLAQPIVALLFRHGQFSAADAVATARTLQAYVLGAPGLIVVRLLSPAFYARGDTRTPVLVTACAFGLDLALTLLLMPWLAHVAIALGDSLAATLNAAISVFLLARRRQLRWDARLRYRLPRIVAATLVMTAGLLLLRPLLPENGRLLLLLLLLLLIGGGGLLYLGAAWRLGIADLAMVRRMVAEKGGSGLKA
ncbi:putative peptidoglycan biosynthesis protein MurJ [mine drainage metagenome]|uniref:Putative peptidoglycan biosynthesis protein MurJ n=1 Tax=mine drainage metagenome TaxID=410659 RepID=A0A1J5S4Y2_9ZZZZ